jgi:signal peptidase I
MRNTGKAGPNERFSTARYVAYACILICAAGLIYLFGLRGMAFFLVPSRSMEPTFDVNDRIVTLKEKAYRRGDIVVLADPLQEGFLVKRIVAVGGDTVMAVGGVLVVNKEAQNEPYVKEPMEYSFTQPLRVPEGEVYLLGDNRNNSDDCHLWPGDFSDGVPTADIIGKVRFIYYPFSRTGPV